MANKFDKAAYALAEQTLRRVKTAKNNYKSQVINATTAMQMVQIALDDYDKTLDKMVNKELAKMGKG